MTYRDMVITILSLSGLFRLFELYWLKRNKKDGVVKSSWTLPVLSAGYSLVLIISIIELIALPKTINVIMSVAGISIMVLRVPVKFWAASTLNKYWSPQVEIRNDHQLIRQGPYKFVRHPAYFAAILELVGVPLAANSFYTLSTISVVLLVLFFIRIHIEEKALTEKFGEEYAAYKRETFALIPFKKYLFVNGGKAGE